jgi:hypothetical protein
MLRLDMDVVGIGYDSTRATGDAGSPRPERSAGHLLGVHRATVYRWLDGSMSVPIVVELLLRLMVRRGIRAAEVTSAKPRSGRSQAKSAKPIVHHNTRTNSKQAAVLDVRRENLSH